MTNFEYIMSKMNDRNLAGYIMRDFNNKDRANPFLAAIDVAFWNWYHNSDREMTLSCEVWLSMQYNPEGWKEEN